MDIHECMEKVTKHFLSGNTPDIVSALMTCGAIAYRYYVANNLLPKDFKAACNYYFKYVPNNDDRTLSYSSLHVFVYAHSDSALNDNEWQDYCSCLSDIYKEWCSLENPQYTYCNAINYNCNFLIQWYCNVGYKFCSIVAY